MMVAEGFLKRLVGIHGVPPGWGVLIPGRSVHGLVIVRRLWAVGLDLSLRVVGVNLLRPGGIAAFGDAGAILELRAERTPPGRGWVLKWKDGAGAWPAS